MIDLNTARQIILERLSIMEREMNESGSGLPGYESQPDLHLVVSKAVEYDFGWVFSYTTKEYLETNDISYALAGNAPLIVDRCDGQVYVAGTARPLEHYIAEYRKGVRVRA